MSDWISGVIYCPLCGERVAGDFGGGEEVVFRVSADTVTAVRRGDVRCGYCQSAMRFRRIDLPDDDRDEDDSLR